MPMIGRRIYPGMKRAAWGFMQSGDFPVPVLHLKFGKNTGAVAYDSSPYGNNGEIEGPTWTKGYLGPGLLFDEIDDYVKVDASPELNITDELTIIARINPNALIRGAIMAKGQWNQPYIFEMRENGKIYFTCALDTGGDKYPHNDTAITVLDKWYEFGVTFNDGLVTIYLNGLPDGVTDYSPDTLDSYLTTDIYIGRYVGGDDTFPGIIDEVTHFNKAFTARQMRQWSQGYR